MQSIFQNLGSREWKYLDEILIFIWYSHSCIFLHSPQYRKRERNESNTMYKWERFTVGWTILLTFYGQHQIKENSRWSIFVLNFTHILTSFFYFFIIIHRFSLFRITTVLVRTFLPHLTPSCITLSVITRYSYAKNEILKNFTVGKIYTLCSYCRIGQSEYIIPGILVSIFYQL